MKSGNFTSALTNLGLAGAAVLLALGGVELGLRLVFPKSERFYTLRPRMVRVLEPAPGALPGIEGPARYETNADGIRARPFGEDTEEYRILAIGGSTTESAYLDEPETWSYILEQGLATTLDGKGVWVGNVGRSGLSSRDHVVQLKYHSEQYPRIDAVVILAGVNDLTIALGQGDAYVQPAPITQPLAERQQVRRAFMVGPGRLHAPVVEYMFVSGAPWYKGTALWQLLKRARMSVTDRRLNAGLIQDSSGAVYGRWRRHRQGASAIRESLPDLSLALEEYRRNLVAIVNIARARSIRVILATQPALWRPGLSKDEKARLWLGGIGDFQTEPNHEYYSVSALAEAIHMYNGTMLQVCVTHKVECVDLATAMPKTTLMHHDDVHFTERGARSVAQVLVDHFSARPPFFEGQ